MTNPSKLPVSLANETTPLDDASAAERSTNRLFESNDEIRQVAKTLAEHGGGAVAFDLALDLVLNEIVEQARSATGATGAAIALTRDGEMVCRATTGGNAPDLGIRVESESGLSGACLKTGEIQDCADTETDARVDAGACRQLGVRSMLIAPVGSREECFGILEVLSARPNAFGEKDVRLLRELATRVAKNKKEAEEGMEAAEFRHGVIEDSSTDEEPHAEQDSKPGDVSLEAEDASRSDYWSTILVLAVILVAVALGLAIGWRAAAPGANSTAQPAVPSSSAKSANQVANPTSNQENAPIQPAPVGQPAPMASRKAQPLIQPRSSGMENPVAAGGLLVTENGKVIFRELPAQVSQVPSSNAVSSPGSIRLIHRVQPEYPAEAKSRHIEGTVILNVQILGDGKVGTISLIKGDPLLSEAAINAVKQWTYTPNAINGQPAESQTRITIKFVLPSS